METRNKVTQFQASFLVNRARFIAPYGTSFLQSSKPVPVRYLRFQTKEPVLRVNKSEITSENDSNENLFGIEDNNESSEDESTYF